MNTEKCPPPDWHDGYEREDHGPFTVASATIPERANDFPVSASIAAAAVERLLGALKSSPAKVVLLRDCMSQACADGNHSERWREEVYALARMLEIDVAQVCALEDSLGRSAPPLPSP